MPGRDNEKLKLLLVDISRISHTCPTLGNGIFQIFRISAISFFRISPTLVILIFRIFQSRYDQIDDVSKFRGLKFHDVCARSLSLKI